LLAIVFELFEPVFDPQRNRGEREPGATPTLQHPRRSELRAGLDGAQKSWRCRHDNESRGRRGGRTNSAKSPCVI